MSHYTVAVLHKKGDNIDDILYPYDEELRVAPYLKLTREQIIKEAKKRKESYLDNLSNKDSYCYKDGKVQDFIIPYLKSNTDEELYNTEKELTFADDDIFDEDGNYLSTYNPNSKWDWYQVGGRWSGCLRIKDHFRDKYCKENDIYTNDEITTDIAPLDYVNFEIDWETYKNAKRFYEVVVENAPLEEGETKDDYFTFYRPEYLKETYKSASIYAKIKASLSTYAIITPDGVWHEAAEMGWFGCSCATPEQTLEYDLNYYDKYIAPYLGKGYYITIVDCHI